METKFCNGCNTEKPITEFYKRSSRPSSPFQSRCKICMDDYRKKQVKKGLCPNCGKEWAGLTKNCSSCIERANTRSKKDRARRKLLGQCYDCEKQAVKNRTRCAECLKQLAMKAKMRNYGLTSDEVAIADDKQKCDCCGDEFPNETIGDIRERKIDHCHNTGKIRGTICHSCNCGLGSFHDDISKLKKAIIYLENYAN